MALEPPVTLPLGTSISVASVPRAVYCQLWSLVSDDHKQTKESAEITNPPTHMEIAIMLNLSRETVTRVFQGLQNQKIVRRDGPSRLIISNLVLLKKYAEGKQNP